LQTTTKLLPKLRRAKRGVSNVIVVVLSLVILVIVTSNIILWSYEMNQLDWERMQESIEVRASTFSGGVRFTFSNEGPSTCHVICVWVINATRHERLEVDVFINAGEVVNHTRNDVNLPVSSYVIKAVTERGNIAIYRLP
jgi:hypothetical protein